MNHLVNRVRRGGPGRRLTLGGGVLAVALIALALYLGGVFDSGVETHASATVAREGVGLAPAGDAPSSPDGAPRPSSREDRARGPDGPILGALQNYWGNIARHQFAAAYGFYAPGALNVSEAQFISNLAGSGLKSVSFSGTVSARTKSVRLYHKSYATVAVTSLVTRDHQHGCRKWSGTYAMVLEESGLWQIQRAALYARPC